MLSAVKTEPHTNISMYDKPLLAKKPQRIVSLSPGNTEILFALGAGDRVVGVTSYSDYPEEAKTKPSIGGYHSPDIEKIVELAPDIVFAMGATQAQSIRILQQLNIPVVSVEPQSMEEILTAIDRISAEIGEPERGSKLHETLARQLIAVRSRTAVLTLKRVFIEVWDTPLLTLGFRSFVNDMIKQAGGVNVAADKNVEYTPCDIETLYAYKPEVYIVVSHNHKDADSLMSRKDIADVPAVKDRQIYALLDDIILRPGPRSFSGLVQLAAILHPEDRKDRVQK